MSEHENKHLNGYVEEDYNEKTFYPTCPFCGAQELPLAVYGSQQQANEAAAMRCQCVGAREHQAKKRAEEERKENIRKLESNLRHFRTFCETRDTEISDDLFDLLLRIGTDILDDKYESAQVNFGRIKSKFGKNSKGNIVLSFNYAVGSKVEV